MTIPTPATQSTGARSPRVSRDATGPILRAAAWAGFASALVILINAAKRSGVLPTSTITQLIAPLGLVFGLLIIVGVYLATDAVRNRAATCAFSLLFVATSLLVGAEFVINLVFADHSDAFRDDLLDGPLGPALTISSILFLVGAVWFAIAIGRGQGSAPRAALAVFAVGAVPIALRAFIPDWLLNSGLVVLAAAVAGMAWWLMAETRTADD